MSSSGRASGWPRQASSSLAVSAAQKRRPTTMGPQVAWSGTQTSHCTSLLGSLPAATTNQRQTAAYLPSHHGALRGPPDLLQGRHTVN